MGAPNFTAMNVTNPDFFKQVNGVIAALPLDSLKTYVTWHVLRGAAPWFRSRLWKRTSRCGRR